METRKCKIKVGLAGVGLETYWGQFNGLLPRLLAYQYEIEEKITQFDADVVNVGMVDNPQKAIIAAELLQTKNVELVFIFISTYALSSTLLPIAQRTNAPIILLNIQPVPAIDYNYINSLSDKGEMTGEWLAHCQACSIPEFTSVFNRSDIKYDIITGYLQEEYVRDEIETWIQAAQVCKGMRDNRMGILGHYYGGMMDVYTDLTMQAAAFGTHIEMLEVDELKSYRDNVTEKELNEKLQELNNSFNIVQECEAYEIERVARTSVALDKMVEKHSLGSMAYYYEGCSGNDHENIVTSVIPGNTLLTGKGIPIAGECEVKNVQAMKIMSLLGAGGSFSEFYAMDFNDDVVLLGHDGPAHFTIAEGEVKLVPLLVYHGKPGKGLSIQMSVRQGEVTLLSVCEGKNGIYLLVAEGESVSGPVLQIGNTNSRYRFTCGAREFMDKWSKSGPSHHCAIGVGHLAHKIDKIGFLLNIPVIKI